MFYGLSKKITDVGVEQKFIDSSKQEEYIYGLELVFAVLLNSVTVVVIGAIMGMVIETIIFWFVYNILRKYSGGFHFNSSLACYLSTYIISPAVLLMIRYLHFDMNVLLVSALISSIIIFVLTPVPAIQKPLDKEEEKVFGRIGRTLICVTFVVYIIFFLFKLFYAAKVLAISIIAVAIFAVAGKIKKVIHDKKVEVR